MSKLPVRREESRVGRFLKRGAYPHITSSEYQELLRASDRAETRILLETMWTLGARISEALVLRAKDLTTREGEFYLNVLRAKRRSLSEVREKIPIEWALGSKLSDFIQLSGKQGNDRLFPVTRKTAWSWVKKLGEKALGQKVTPHMFRHGRIYDLASRGVHPFAIARIVGHVDIQTTLAYYHPSDEDIRIAMSM